ncbi:uncharacterized protein LOC117165509 isoform X2 [Bombus vancouverensis nearcticus]|uniref:uncharacterized protein LOC117165509 isoform X2 n=1 Tax=Bombus vancouverensis nearcticus TaxID=2705178 RepID=UPI00402B0855
MDYFVGEIFEISYFKTGMYICEIDMKHNLDQQVQISLLTMYIFLQIWSTIASVGWYIIGITICIWWASPYILEKYANWKLRKNEQEYAAKYHKNPDLLQERLIGLEASRQKMQEEYYQKCMLAEEERTEKGNAKGIPKLILDNNVIGDRPGKKNNDSPPFTEKKHKSIREGYNPLMGDGSRGYRPPKRTCCGKGSCG